jgi:hypothetical protein
MNDPGRQDKSALEIGARASRPLSRERPAPVRGQDAHTTAGETPALHPSTVERFSSFPGARQTMGMSDSFENDCGPAPFPIPRPTQIARSFL